MSVEQEHEQSTLLQKQDGQPIVVEETEMEVQTASLTVEEESCRPFEPTSETEEIPSDSKLQEPPTSSARTWYESLSKEERLAALSFRDGAFLRSFLSVASWCRQEPTDPELVAYTSGVIDWEAMVPWEAFEILGSESRRSDDDKVVESGCMTTSTLSSMDAARSEAFRIRNISEGGDIATTESRDSKSNDAAISLLNHLCVVFPSAYHQTIRESTPSSERFEHIEGFLDGSSIPMMALNSKLLDVLDDVRVLLALDTMSVKASGFPFLSNESIEWLHSKHAEKMPLYAAMMARLIGAAVYEHGRHLTNDSDLTRQWQMMQRIADHCRSTTFKPPTLAALSESFLGPCPERFFVESPMETLSLTPLSWLVQHASGRCSTGGVFDFSGLDKGLLKLLTNSSNKKVEDKLVETAQSTEMQPTLARKKKKSKKKNRQKHRTSSNADTIVSKASEPEMDPTFLVASVDEADDFLSELKAPEKAEPESKGANAQPTALQPSSEVLLSVVSVDSDDASVGQSRTDSVDFDDGSHRLSTEQQDSSLQGIQLAAPTDVFVTTVSAKVGSGSTDEKKPSSGAEEQDDHAWETVETKPRVSRKKPITSAQNAYGNGMRSGQHLSMNDHVLQGDVQKKKGHHRLSTQKKAKAGRKAVRDILNSLLDRVDDEVRRKATQQAARKSVPANPGVNVWKCGPPPAKQGVDTPTKAGSGVASTSTKKDVASSSLRDVVLGRHIASAPPVKSWAKAASAPVAAKSSVAAPKQPDRTVESQKPPEAQKPPFAWKTEKQQSQSNILSKNVPKTKVHKADQNTAPTYQETLSSSSLTNAAMKSSPTGTEDRGSKSETSSGNTEEVSPYHKAVSKSKASDKKSENIPPLPMLLNHDNANSANSSVASSLEAPHATRHHHHHSSTPDVNDVGYHLLDVCDKLSRDMRLFMTRRSLALNTRREERGAILAALQDTVDGIWGGSGHAEMYGSCATQTDLPSSDIDVVVVGLDFSADMRGIIDQSRSGSSADLLGSSQSFEEAGNDNDSRPMGTHSQLTVSSFAPLQVQRMMSAERVKRLGAELERKPWAVKVNAIPTASVPVVKVLADPAKLSGGARMDDLLVHATQAHASTSALVTDAGSVGSHQSANGTAQLSQHQYNPPWRGADIMNGLLSLDITFEGAGHGGIGSTNFSARVIADACHEAGVHPDETVLVQTMMVIKELLAQRKLNEPYSGGLSSYAVLLLVLALLQERAVIREEIERAEMQRRAMSSDVSSGSFTSAKDVNATPKAGPAKSPLTGSLPINGKGQQRTKQVTHRTGSSASSVSSWASVAKKPNGKDYSKTKKSDKIEPKASNFAATASRARSTATCVTGAQKLQANGPADSPVTLASSMLAGVNEKISGNALDSPLLDTPSVYPQGYNDIIEVLCSGETTAGKLLMHFFLHYGQHFDAQSTAIDVSGKHERDFSMSPYSYFSPYITRRSAGTIDPVTGMLTVDPIVVYDPLEGAENNNVARRCFAWNSVRWIFAQSYATLSSAVERSASPPSSPAPIVATSSSQDLVGESMDPSSPLLSCLLSF